MESSNTQSLQRQPITTQSFVDEAEQLIADAEVRYNSLVKLVSDDHFCRHLSRLKDLEAEAVAVAYQRLEVAKHLAANQSVVN
ncbi:MAG: hypothetical protein ACI9HK_004403 [Pirellulaceae bacterium]|jgi:hypothetical protein